MMGRSHQTLNITIGYHTLKQVQSFRYLGSTVNQHSTQEEEIKNRIAKYSQNVGCMNRLLKDRNVPKKPKQIIHQTILRPILIFGSECWTLTKRLEQQITTADMNVIRMIQFVTRWDRKRNENMYKQSNAHCSSDQQEQPSMVWPCHEEGSRVNADGCNEVKYGVKETKRKTKTRVAR